MQIKRITAMTLAAILAVGTMSCGGETSTKDKGNDTGTTSAADTTSEYDYPDENFGGYEFTFFNADKQYGCYIRLDFEEQTGESLDDAVYNRNSRIEDRFNIKISEYQADGSTAWATSQAEMCNQIARMVMAGDCDYDAAYLPVYFQPGVVTDGYLTDLNTIPELQLDKPWWDNVFNDEIEINGCLYTASSPLHLMSLDLSWLLLFNKDMMDDRSLEYPYQLVKDGKWTLDQLNSYLTGVASLNGDESFTWNGDGKAIYGIAGHLSAPAAMVFSAGNRLMTRDGDSFEFTAGTERMYSTIEKLAAIFDSTSGNTYADNTSDTKTKKGYIYAFGANRALFTTCELKTALELRYMEASFGLLPMPKYDEEQEDYITYTNYGTCLLTIPTTNSETHRTGVILDALSYDSYKNVLPVYYDVTVSQKGLRDEESIEMLDIVRNTRSPLFSDVYGITSTLNSAIQNEVINASGTAASTIAAAKTTVEENLQKVLDAFSK